MKKKLSLRATLFVAILAVALVCILASALLSNYISQRQIGQFVQEHQNELVGSVPHGSRPYSTAPPSVLDRYRNPFDPGADRRGAPPPPQPRNINLGFILAGILGLVLALALGFLLAGRISKPLDGLTAATGRISGGDFSERVPITGAKEVEELGIAFNSLAESLEKNEELRQHMVADVAHELRNPLATLRGQLELMQDGKIDCSKEAVDSLVEDVVLLSHIVDDLSQLSLVDAGKLEFHLQEVSPARLIAEAVSRFEHEAGAARVSLESRTETGLPSVNADPARLAQVLGNLVGNALAHTPEGGSVTIGAAHEGEFVTFNVTDSGTGIEAAELPHIFDRFYRTDKSRTRATGGAGLGLSIAKSLVEAQGGGIKAASAPGEGTTVSFTMPVYPLQAP